MCRAILFEASSVTENQPEAKGQQSGAHRNKTHRNQHAAERHTLGALGLKQVDLRVQFFYVVNELLNVLRKLRTGISTAGRSLDRTQLMCPSG
eukprot:JP440241.1.p2 GENE.JP440241.1~~JP440241.1.p2  ORF type:complete len:93 (-),score=16.87 JP440241.1:38-316(-)